MRDPTFAGGPVWRTAAGSNGALQSGFRRRVVVPVILAPGRGAAAMASRRYGGRMVSSIGMAGLWSVAVWGVADGASAQGEGPGAWPVKVPREDVLQRRKDGKPLWDTQWIVRDDGVLTQLPNPAASGPTTQGYSFVGDENQPARSRDALVRTLSVWLQAGGSWACQHLAPALRCPGDLLGATLAERHFAQLGRDASVVALRQFLMQPAGASDGPSLRREQLDRELAVRLLQRTATRAAVGEMRSLARDAGDPFLRRAAATAHAVLGDAAAPLPVALSSLSIEVPAAMAFWLWVDMGNVAARPDITSAVHTARVEEMWDHVLDRDPQRGISDVLLAGAQHRIDVFDELPYEVARTWGRARIDQCLLGFRWVDGDCRLMWAAASGAFEVEALTAHLGRCGIAIETNKGRLHTSEWWPDHEVEVAADHVVVRHKRGVGAIGKWPAVVDEAIARHAAIAGELLPSVDSPSVPWLLLGGEGVATVRLQPFSLSVTSKLSVDDARAFCRDRATRIDASDRVWKVAPPELRQRCRTAIEAATVTPIDGTGRVRIEVTGKDLDPLLLWPLLR